MADGRKGLSTEAMQVISGVVGLLVLLGLWLLVTHAFIGALLMGLVVGGMVFLILYYGYGGTTADSANAAPASSGTSGPQTDSTGAGTGLNAMAEDPAPFRAAQPEKTPEPAPTPEAAPAPKPDPEPAPEPISAAPEQTVATAPAEAPLDKSPKTSADPADEGEGEQPEMMSAPRDGGADNLKEIKGVGPKLEELLHSLGVYHFDQIAGWGPSQVAWMDQNLKGFRGRVSRDDWVEQAKILAAGGDTEFSSRVDKGEVY